MLGAAHVMHSSNFRASPLEWMICAQSTLHVLISNYKNKTCDPSSQCPSVPGELFEKMPGPSMVKQRVAIHTPKIDAVGRRWFQPDTLPDNGRMRRLSRMHTCTIASSLLVWLLDSSTNTLTRPHTGHPRCGNGADHTREDMLAQCIVGCTDHHAWL